MTQQPRLTRRSMAGTVMGGMVLGGIWGATFPALAMEERQSIAVIGDRDSQLILVDSTETRALVLVGDPGEGLMERIPAVMTVFRQRIDLIIGSQPALARQTKRLEPRWRIQHAILLQGNVENTTTSMPATSVADIITVGLGGGMVVRCQIGQRGAWDATRPAREKVLWAISIEHPGGVTAIAPDAESLDAVNPGPATLLITPGLSTPSVSNRLPAEAFACNYNGPSIDEIKKIGKPLTRVYPRDIARFVLHENGIDVPPWTYQP